MLYHYLFPKSEPFNSMAIMFQTVYLPVNATGGEDVVRLFAMVGSNSFWQFYSPFNLTIDPSFVANYTWNIKVQQIDCSHQDNPLQGE